MRERERDVCCRLKCIGFFVCEFVFCFWVVVGVLREKIVFGLIIDVYVIDVVLLIWIGLFEGLIICMNVVMVLLIMYLVFVRFCWGCWEYGFKRMFLWFKIKICIEIIEWVGMLVVF